MSRVRAAARSGGGSNSIYIDSEEFHALFVATRAWDKKLYTELRKALRESAKPMVDAIKREIAQIPSSGRYHSGVRSGLQGGTRASIRAASARTAGVRIVTSGSRLGAKAPLAKAMNQRSFRHPVFGGRGSVRRFLGAGQATNWVSQPGNPYFGKTVMEHRDDVARDMLRAVERAVDSLKADI